MATKTADFQSILKKDYAVVEERKGDLHLYPHTDQLPTILRILDTEFKIKLPARIARVDHRANDFDKIVLKMATTVFCHWFNNSRSDKLQLFSLLDRNRVAKLAIVQQIQEHTPLGLTHRFKFYTSNDFFPDIFLSGRRLIFTDHALKQFLQRAPELVGEGLTTFMLTFFTDPYLVMPCNGSFAFVIPYDESIIALPFYELNGEFVVLTCLGLNEINSLELEVPVHALNLHYDSPFIIPAFRHWSPTLKMFQLHERWERKAAYTRIKLPRPKMNWYDLAHDIKGFMQHGGHGSGSRLFFMDNVPGPASVEYLPDATEIRFNEIEQLSKQFPDKDWPAMFAELNSRIYSRT